MNFKKYIYEAQLAAFCLLTVAVFVALSVYRMNTKPLVSAADIKDPVTISTQTAGSGNTSTYLADARSSRYQSMRQLSRGIPLDDIMAGFNNDSKQMASLAAATPKPTPAPTPVPTPEPTPAPTPEPDPNAPMIPILNGTMLAPDQASRPMVFFGDSLTTDAYSAINQFWEYSSVFNQYNLQKVGSNGYHTNQAVNLVWDVVALKPRTVFIMFGTNDMWGGISPYTALNNIAYIVETIKGNVPDCTIVLQAIPPFGRQAFERNGLISNYYVQLYNQGLRDMAIEKGVSFVDIGALYKDSEGYMGDSYTNDGIHITVYNFGFWLRKLINLGLV